MLHYTNPLSALTEQSIDISHENDTQSISGNNIDPAKLARLLRVKFGAGSYGLHVSTLAVELFEVGLTCA